MMFNEILFLVFRIFLGLLLVFTGMLKLFNLKKFYSIAIQYEVLPRKLIKYYAYSLPFFEVIVGLFLLLKFELLIVSIIGLLMMMASTIGILNVLMKHKKLEDCGCYIGVLKVPVTWKKFVENIAYVLMFVYMILLL